MDMAKLTESAMKEATNDQAESHLNELLMHQQMSIARLEAQRKMWSEVEKKNIMAVLEAMSLLADSKLATEVKELPKYSPFRTTKAGVWGS